LVSAVLIGPIREKPASRSLPRQMERERQCFPESRARRPSRPRPHLGMNHPQLPLRANALPLPRLRRESTQQKVEPNSPSFDQALGTITIDAARILGIDNRVGPLEVGKDGDVALYDGDPFEYTTHCTACIIAGKVVSDTPR
jgi:hypothetical protein